MDPGRLPAKEFRRLLRRQATDAEARLWSHLRARRLGAKFRRQHSLGAFILDFFSPEAMLAIEVDGGQHFEEAHRRRDQRRDAFLAGKGIEVLRFTDREVLLHTEAVAGVIWEAVGRRVGSAEGEPSRSP
jgi:very-short-patch-repair endonuclease